ncbi:integrase core domain-containing protein [Nocardia rhamnosiphila]|uniref:integrase core domain-containing protein n=1 Tax=Nocardia rhamnosiphila TaxID=426716 RepID=UPI003F4CC5AC
MTRGEPGAQEWARRVRRAVTGNGLEPDQFQHRARDRPYIESFNRRLRTECLNRNHWTSLLEARVVIGDFKTDHNLRHRHSSLGYRTPAEYAAACTHTHHPVDCEIN